MADFHYDQDAEQSVIGSMLEDNKAIPICAEMLTAESFLFTPHKILFSACVELNNSGKPADPVTIANTLGEADLNRIGGIEFISDLRRATPSAANAEYYAEIVQSAFIRRQLDASAKQILSLTQEEQDIEETKAKAQELILKVGADVSSYERLSMSDQVNNTYERLLNIDRGEHIEISTGFKQLDELTGGLHRKEFLILAGLASVGKCLTGDTSIVNCKTGQMKTIKEIYDEQTIVCASLDNDYKLTKSEPSSYIDNGRKEVYRVTTMSGRTIKVTEAHPFLTINSWKPLNELMIGERIATPRAMPVWGNDTMPDSEIKLLAYLIGDGGLTGTSPRFTNGNMDIIADFTEAVCELSHPQLSLWEMGNGMKINEEGSSSLTYRVAGKKINLVTELCRKHEIMGKLAIEKEIPKAIFTCPRQQIALFLNRLYACDGSAYVTKDVYPGIDYSTSSQVMAHQVQHLLLRFGIVSRLRSRMMKYKNTYRPTYNVVILSKAGIMAFANEIGIFSKESKLGDVAHLASQHSDGFTDDVIPVDVVKNVRDAKDKSGKTWVDLGKALGHSRPKDAVAYGLKNRNRNYTRKSLQFCADVFDDAYLKKLSYSDIFWDRIKSIEYVGVEQVYDLEIPEYHNFVANDIIVHNSCFAHNLLYNIAVKDNVPAVLFCYESNHVQVLLRMIAAQSGVSVQNNSQEALSNPAIEVLSKLKHSNLIIEDACPRSIEYAASHCRRLKLEHPDLAVAVFDHIHLMTADIGKYDNREREVSKIGDGLKDIAKSLNMATVGLSQLSRASIRRQEKRPMLDDLRASGTLEANADGVAFVHRDDYYEPTTLSPISEAELIMRKNRDGPVGTLKYNYYRAISKFEEA